jgi:hypothetical protein
MDRAELVAFVRRRGQAVLATRGADGAPVATPVGIAITDEAEIIFDTSTASREFANIEAFPLVALVIGGGEDMTLQSEGPADVLSGPDRDRCLRAYFQQHPAGRARAATPGVAHVRIRPDRMRLNDYRPNSYGVQEIQLD